MKVVIFAGGVGTRLWPLSRKNTPKQFEKIVGDKSTLQLAYDRVSPIFKPSDIFISSGIRYKDLIMSQLPDVPAENFIFEPEMRDVGAAVGLVAAILQKISPNEPFFILWSDHLVKNEEVFRKVIITGNDLLKEDNNKIVFMAQDSRFASQNLGWIEQGDKIKEADGLSVFGFKSFHYRPDIKKAEDFHKSKMHYWNPGYFGTTAEFLFSLYKKFAPEMHKELLNIQKHWGKDNFQEKLNKTYPNFEKISFDNLILEKIDPSDGYVIGCDLGWSDIGAWESLKEALVDKEDDNLTKGKVMVEDSKDSLIFNYTNQMVVGIDLDQMLVVNTDDVILVCPKKSVPKVKKLVESLSGTPNENLS